jgi:hypothetical protein
VGLAIRRAPEDLDVVAASTRGIGDRGPEAAVPEDRDGRHVVLLTSVVVGAARDRGPDNEKPRSPFVVPRPLEPPFPGGSVRLVDAP